MFLGPETISLDVYSGIGTQRERSDKSATSVYLVTRWLVNKPLTPMKFNFGFTHLGSKESLSLARHFVFGSSSQILSCPILVVGMVTIVPLPVATQSESVATVTFAISWWCLAAVIAIA